jgi:hypothetical protein
MPDHPPTFSLRSPGPLLAAALLGTALVPVFDSWGPEPLEANAVAVALLAICVFAYCAADRAGRETLRDVALVAGASLSCSIAAAAGPTALVSDVAVAVIAGRIVWGDIGQQPLPRT